MAGQLFSLQAIALCAVLLIDNATGVEIERAMRLEREVMGLNKTTGFLLLMLTAAIIASPAWAKSQWQKPVVMECSLAPGSDCNLEAQCPADAPFIVVGGGGMPKAKPADHAVAMTMNLPISQQKWRVRWRNLSSDVKADIKVAVRIKCSDNASEAGW